jgi:hypothetical protein
VEIEDFVPLVLRPDSLWRNVDVIKSIYCNYKRIPNLFLNMTAIDSVLEVVFFYTYKIRTNETFSPGSKLPSLDSASTGAGRTDLPAL